MHSSSHQLRRFHHADQMAMPALLEQTLTTLNLGSFEGFFKFFHSCLLTTGLMVDLPNFRSEDAELQAVIQQLYHSLLAGLDWESALRGLSPALPGVLVELLILGAAQAQLDLVVEEINAHYQNNPEETNLYEALSRQLASIEAGPNPALICQGCLVQALEKILARAQLEQAHRVLLKQRDNAFFEQGYLGVKLIQIREPGHALTYRSLFQTLETACQSGSLPGEGWSHAYTVQQTGPCVFRVASPDQALECVFLTPLDELP